MAKGNPRRRCISGPLGPYICNQNAVSEHLHFAGQAVIADADLVPLPIIENSLIAGHAISPHISGQAKRHTTIIKDFALKAFALVHKDARRAFRTDFHIKDKTEAIKISQAAAQWLDLKFVVSTKGKTFAHRSGHIAWSTLCEELQPVLGCVGQTTVKAQLKDVFGRNFEVMLDRVQKLVALQYLQGNGMIAGSAKVFCDLNTICGRSVREFPLKGVTLLCDTAVSADRQACVKDIFMDIAGISLVGHDTDKAVEFTCWELRARSTGSIASRAGRQDQQVRQFSRAKRIGDVFANIVIRFRIIIIEDEVAVFRSGLIANNDGCNIVEDIRVDRFEDQQAWLFRGRNFAFPKDLRIRVPDDCVIGDQKAINISHGNPVTIAVINDIVGDLEIGEIVAAGIVFLDLLIADEDRLRRDIIGHQDIAADRDVLRQTGRSAPELDQIGVVEIVQRAVEAVNIVVLDFNILDGTKPQTIALHLRDLVVGDNNLVRLAETNAIIIARNRIAGEFYIAARAEKTYRFSFVSFIGQCAVGIMLEGRVYDLDVRTVLDQQVITPFFAIGDVDTVDIDVIDAHIGDRFQMNLLDMRLLRRIGRREDHRLLARIKILQRDFENLTRRELDRPPAFLTRKQNICGFQFGGVINGDLSLA